MSTSTQEKAVICRGCAQWESAADDVYCSFCGALLIGLELEEDVVVLFDADEKNQRTLRLHNKGEEDIQVTIFTADEKVAAVRFGTDELEIPAGQQVSISLSLDRDFLPSNFSRLIGEYLCAVNGDRRRSARFRVVIQPGPRPVLKTNRLDFGRLQEGERSERRLRIANEGGTHLQIREIRAEGNAYLRLEAGEEERLPLEVGPGKDVSLRVVWDAQEMEVEQELGEPGFRILFDGALDDLFVPAAARVSHRAVAFSPPELEWDPALAGHDLGRQVWLRNTGTDDVEVRGVEVSAQWIEVVSEREMPFTLAGQKIEEGEAGAQDAEGVWVLVDSSDLSEGRHEAEISVQTDGEPITLAVRLQVVEPEPYREYLGIDFGTTNSVMAFSAAGPQQSIDLVEVVDQGSTSQKDPLVPSLLVFHAAGRWHEIGRKARAEINAAAERSVRSIKRVLGSNSEHEFFERKYKPEEIVALIVRRLVQMAELHAYREHGRYVRVRRAIVTAPVNFFGPQVHGLLRACQLAGLEVEGLTPDGNLASDEPVGTHGMVVSEPAAAALFYLSSLGAQKGEVQEKLRTGLDRAEGLRLLIYDHGGGTLDVALVKLRRRDDGTSEMAILSSLGNDHVGGDSFDLRLMERLVERCQAEHQAFDDALILSSFQALEKRRKEESWSTQAWTQVLTARDEWKDAAEHAKIALSANDEARVHIAARHILQSHEKGRGKFSSSDRAFRTDFDREDFEGAVGDLLEEAGHLVDAVLADAKVSRQDVDFVFHTGRQSLTPIVRARIDELMPDTTASVLHEESLKICVAKGAAVHARMLSEPGGIEVVDAGRRLPFSYGFQMSDTFGQRIFREVIPRGAEYPVSEEVVYPVVSRNGRSLLRVYQNGSSSNILDGNKEARCIGTVEIELDGERDRKPLVSLHVDLNRNLLVHVNKEPVDLQPWSWDEEEESWSW